jgi:hypothetical protein
MVTGMPAAQSDERTWHFKQLRVSLQQLVGSASRQKPLFPDLVVTANELAMNFDHWATIVRDAYGDDVTDAQRSSLTALDETFHRMSRDAADFDADVWTDTAVKTSEHWVAVRRLALEALEAFGWLEDGARVDALEHPTDVAE